MPTVNKHDVVRAFAGEHLTIWFVGAGRAFKSGSAPRYKAAPHYRHMGVFTEDAEGRLFCEGMDFTRHHSKISAILDRHGTLLYGQYCGKCKAPVPLAHGNCPRCCNEYRVPTAQAVAMVEARITALAEHGTSSARASAGNVLALPASAPRAPHVSHINAQTALEQIASQEANLRAIIESDDAGKDVLLAKLLQEVIDVAKAGAQSAAQREASDADVARLAA